MATPIPKNRARFSVEEVVEATSGRLALAGTVVARSVCTDTRSLETEAMFVALVGERFDAHAFLAGATDAGATILVVQDCEETRQFLAACQTRSVRPSVVVVADTTHALGQLARHHRRRFQVRVAAVVGSAGKTTTRAVISALLEEVAPGQILSTRGNLNNRIGVPMTLLGLSPAHLFAVVELGTNQPGEIAALGEIAVPDVAVLTLIDLEHTEGLVDLDGVEAEEGAIFDYLGPDGTAVGFGDDERVLRQVKKHVSSLTYGETVGHDLQIAQRRVLRPDELSLRLRRRDGTELKFSSKLIGRAGALAAAAGVAAVERLARARLTQEQCQRALSRTFEPGRHSLLRLAGPRYVVDDTYNSNPASVENSLLTGLELAKETGGRLWLVLGEMLELGALSASAHDRMGELVSRSEIAGAFFVQGEAKRAYEICHSSGIKAAFFPHSRDVAPELTPLVQPRDVVVVKASRGVRAERVVEGLTSFFGLEETNPP